ncbi:hypothetical protein GA0115260_102226, partial [Streptomyces sp. MnatMP-M27]
MSEDLDCQVPLEAPVRPEAASARASRPTVRRAEPPRPPMGRGAAALVPGLALALALAVAGTA